MIIKVFLFFIHFSGRYGYVDIDDGIKREYTYETGILCDPNKRDLEEDDYQEEKAALADLANRNKPNKKPAAPQQQQQYYRN